MSAVIVTTSWDDGHRLDLRLVDLLKKYRIRATFYISPKNREFDKHLLLAPKEITQLSKDFEVGSHTLTHPVLTKVSIEELKSELIESKKYIEKLTGKKVSSFCYPRGEVNSQVKKQVQLAGYSYARTTENYVLKKPTDLLAAGTSIETHRLPYNHIGRELMKLLRYFHYHPVFILKNLSWEKRAIALFDNVYENGGIFHLWGHSWVIEKEGGWRKLETVLAHISKRSDVKYLTNGELQRAIKK